MKINKFLKIKLNKSMESNIRQATHSGSWYSNSKDELSTQISTFFKNSEILSEISTKNKFLKSIIVPHAGYRFSGPTAGWAYICVNKDKYKRIIILGPSHHAYFEGCGLTKFSYYETPLGNIKIDSDSNKFLKSKKNFKELDNSLDEEEHSLEMQLPFLKYIFQDKNIELLPIMVGDINSINQEEIADSLIKYYKDKETLFVISSDFCHWGKRFKYTYYDKNCGKIHESIENLDKIGMEAISSMDPEIFNEYISNYKNTICGRKPISVMLSIVSKFNKEMKGESFIKFVQYNQSSKVIDKNDSSVSYAVGLNFVDEDDLI